MNAHNAGRTPTARTILGRGGAAAAAAAPPSSSDDSSSSHDSSDGSSEEEERVRFLPASPPRRPAGALGGDAGAARCGG